jgi:KaiC/GvpD/RAD55 family RecA-like ATPase
VTKAATHVPPQNVEMEKSVLGALLVAEPTLTRVIDEVKLDATDFYLDRHRIIFEAIHDLYAASKPVDELSVIEALSQRSPAIVSGKKVPAIDVAGGKHYVSELAAMVPAAGNAKHYAEVVLDKSVEREREEVGRALIEGLDPAEATERLEKISRRLTDAAREGAQAVSFASVQRESVSWLWPGRIPLGMLTLLMGDPGLGKSLLTTMLAANVSRAGADVLLLSAEDHKGATIRPRLDAAGADLHRVHHVEVRRDGVEEGLALPDDGAELARLVEETKARLVVVDPLMAHLPESVNSWSDQSVRRALAPLYHLAATHRCAVVIVAHLNKARGGNALHRTGGSIGIPAAVRSALLLARDPEDPDPERGSQRVLAHVKSNISTQAQSLNCEIHAVDLGDGSEAPALRMLGESAVSAEDLLGAPTEEARTERDEAVEFLQEELSLGARPAKEIDKARRDAGISERTLRRARESLGIKPQKNGLNGAWTWELPQDAQGVGATQDGQRPGHVEEDDHPYIPSVAIFDSHAVSTVLTTTGESQDVHPEDIGHLDAEDADWSAA